jgi:DNA-binding PadR family transcriptional regulator
MDGVAATAGSREVDMASKRTTIEDLLPLTQRVFLILWALSEQEAHGYRLLTEVERLGRGRVSIKPGSLYEAIGALADRGLIAAVDDGGDAGGRRRKVFRLTGLGREVLDAEARRLAVLVDDLRASEIVEGPK